MRILPFFPALVFFLLYQNGICQFIALSAGTSLPSGSYASKDINNNSAAFASPGLLYQASFAYKSQDYFIGLSVLMRHQSNNFDAKVFENELGIKYPGITWTAKSTPWNSNFFMIGSYSPFKLDSGRTSIYLKFMVGAASCVLPSVSIYGQQGNASYWKKTDGSTGLSAAYLAGVGLKYNINDYLCFVLDADYLGAKPDFKNVKSYDSNGIMKITSLSQSISSYNFSAGLGLKL